MTTINTDDTNIYVGPFCTCGDYSCPASESPTANCINREGTFSPDDDTEAYEVIEDEHGNQTKVMLEAGTTAGPEMTQNPTHNRHASDA